MSYLKSYKLFESKFTDDYDLSEHNFNCGDCDVYAIALHRIYGYPLYVVNGYFKEDDWNEEEGYTSYFNEPAHIVVKLPNGNYMDSDGEITEQQLKDDCGFGNKIEYIKIEEITEEEAMHVYSGEDQEEDIQRIIKFIKNKSNISESLVSKDINKEDIKSLFLEITDLDFNIDVTFLRYNHKVIMDDYDPEYLDGFSVFLSRIKKEIPMVSTITGWEGHINGIPIAGSISIDEIYDTIAVAEEYILDVYDKPLTSIIVWPICISGDNFFKFYDLEKLAEFNKNLKENYDHPFIYQIELNFDRQKVKEPISKFKKFINKFR